MIKIDALRKELTQQTVGVFIGATLPAMIRMGKITPHTKSTLKFLKARKLPAVIECHRFYLFRRQILHCLERRLCHRIGRLIIQFNRYGVPAFAFNVRRQKPGALTTKKRVRLPVAHTFTLVDNLWPFINHTPIRHLPATFLAAISLAATTVTLT